MERDFQSHPSDIAPVCNVTIPVFNRPGATRETLLALRRTSQEVPFDITVVDNGSDPALVGMLLEFRERGVIDHLFLLPRNMGVACAANVGWELVPAPIYMKLDNDTAMRRTRWLPGLLALWRHGRPQSKLGGAFNLDMLRRHPGATATPEGPLGVCPGNLPGQAVLIPKAVSDELGFWNEEYGLYGGEDGDYGLRMSCAGFPQYYYHGPDYFENLPEEDAQATYAARGIDKRRLHRELVVTDNLLPGKLFLNKILYASGVRSLKPMRRYEIIDIADGCRVSVAERGEYREFRRDLAPHLAAVNRGFKEHLMSFRPDPATTQALKAGLARHGQAGRSGGTH